MAIVTKLQSAKKLCCKTRLFQKSLANAKASAHRAYRRAARQAIKVGGEVNEKPRLTGWDII